MGILGYILCTLSVLVVVGLLIIFTYILGYKQGIKDSVEYDERD